jgi:cytochrome c553
MASLCGAEPASAFEDSIAQRVLACTGCHGKEGRAASDGYYPRIAGKPAGYLYNQLVNFRDGRRHYPLMTQLIDPLSNAYLQEIAGYFADLDVPYPAPQPATVTPAVLARGEALALRGDSTRGIPACAQFGAWKTGSRRAASPDCMADIARALAPDDVSAVAQWLGAQAIPVQAKAIAQLPAAMPKPCGGIATEAQR